MVQVVLVKTAENTFPASRVGGWTLWERRQNCGSSLACWPLQQLFGHIGHFHAQMQAHVNNTNTMWQVVVIYQTDNNESINPSL